MRPRERPTIWGTDHSHVVPDPHYPQGLAGLNQLAMTKKLKSSIDRHQKAKDQALQAHDWQAAQHHGQAISMLITHGVHAEHHGLHIKEDQMDTPLRHTQRVEWHNRAGNSEPKLVPVPQHDGRRSAFEWSTNVDNPRRQAAHMTFKEFAMMERARRAIGGSEHDKVFHRKAKTLLQEMADAMEKDVNQQIARRATSPLASQAEAEIAKMAQQRRRHELLQQAKEVCEAWVSLEHASKLLGAGDQHEETSLAPLEPWDLMAEQPGTKEWVEQTPETWWAESAMASEIKSKLQTRHQREQKHRGGESMSSTMSSSKAPKSAKFAMDESGLKEEISALLKNRRSCSDIHTDS